MPELPEVETIKICLSKSIERATIKEVVVLNHNLRYLVPEEIGRIEQVQIVSIKRRAKYLQFFLSNEQVLLFHLGMSGSLLLENGNYQEAKHDHCLFFLEPDMVLRYNDPRRFGFIDMLKLQDLPQYKLLQNLGVEPLSDELNIASLTAILANSKLPMKKLLMQNEHIVGIGNIYASEILFASKIAPTTLSCSLHPLQIADLLQNIKIVLLKAIDLGGSSIRNFVVPTNHKGGFSSCFNVYGRWKKPCYICQTPIEKSTIAGRSTFFCPNCQV
jgi:formamidopyrimidine-DNA glycosylase